ncbi:protein glass, partial [Biomphalaria pfeifferi]
ATMDSPYTTSSSNVDPWRTDLDDQSPPPNIFFDLTPRDHGGEGNMASLGLSPMELEQLPNFFSLPPCAPYKYGHLSD